MLFNRIRLDSFAYKQFDTDSNYIGTKIPIGKLEFMEQLYQQFNKCPPVLCNGYAPFCKHIFIRNWIPGVKVGTIAITEQNSHLLKSGYVARTQKELPVLSRWFPRDSVEVPDAHFLDLILYSKDQIDKESEAMCIPAPIEDYEYAIISIKGQNEDHEILMNPITMMRNSLGKSEGGSGVAIDRKAYGESVAYWETHANVL